MATDFAVSLRRFLTGHLAGLRGYSPNTIVSYRDTFKLLARKSPVNAAHAWARGTGVRGGAPLGTKSRSSFVGRLWGPPRAQAASSIGWRLTL